MLRHAIEISFFVLCLPLRLLLFGGDTSMICDHPLSSAPCTPFLIFFLVPLHSHPNCAALGQSRGARCPSAPAEPFAHGDVPPPKAHGLKAPLSDRADEDRLLLVLDRHGAPRRSVGDLHVVGLVALEPLAPLLWGTGEQGG